MSFHPHFFRTLLALGACAPILSGAQNAGTTQDTVRTETAEYFGVSRGAVRISDYEKGLLATNYKATVGGTLYNCNYYYLSVNCARPGEGVF